MISQDLFNEMLEKAIVMYERAKQQIAKAPVPRQQEDLDRLTLWHTLNNIMNYYWPALSDEDRSGLRKHLEREIKLDQGTKAAAEKVRLGSPQKSFEFVSEPSSKS
jgi:hypothetical protein